MEGAIPVQLNFENLLDSLVTDIKGWALLVILDGGVVGDALFGIFLVHVHLVRSTGTGETFHNRIWHNAIVSGQMRIAILNTHLALQAAGSPLFFLI